MPNKFQRHEIGKEVFFSSVTDTRFKFNMISVSFLVPLSEETASEYALISRIIDKSCKEYPTFGRLSSKLSSLYNASIYSDVIPFGDSQVVEISIGYIDDKYALDNEKTEEEAIKILLGCLFEPLLENGVFPKKTVSLERGILIDDIKSEINDKQAYANHKADQIMYKGEPAAVRALGSVEQAKRVTALTAFNAYKRLLKHSRVEIICSGCSSFSSAEKAFSRAFAQVERGDFFRCSTKKSPLKSEPQSVYEEMRINQSKLVMGFKTGCENYSALYLMSAIYGGMSTSKLFMNVREKLSLCYYCWSGVDRYKGSLWVSSGVDRNNLEKAENEITAQLEALKRGDFTDEDIENAKMYRKNGLKAYNDSLKSMAAWYLMSVYSDDIKSPEDAVKENDRVTREEIVDAANSVSPDTVYALIPPQNEQEKEALD